jgi:hypothetical protein
LSKRPKENEMTTMVDERLAEVGRHIDELEARLRARGAEHRQRMRRHAVALRHEQANALAAARRAPAHNVDDRVARLRSRLEVAERSLDADVAEDRSAFTAAVEAELHSWDGFAERLQASAAAHTGPARDQAEAAITALRRQRLTVTERLDALRAARWETWREQRMRVTAAREDLERMADDLSASLF